MKHTEFLKSKLDNKDVELISLIESLDEDRLKLLERYFLKIKKANDNGDVTIKQIKKLTHSYLSITLTVTTTFGAP